MRQTLESVEVNGGNMRRKWESFLTKQAGEQRDIFLKTEGEIIKKCKTETAADVTGINKRSLRGIVWN